MRKETGGALPEISDTELVIRVKDGDPEAFPLLTERYMPMILWRAGRYSNIAGAEQEDFMQEGLLALYRAADTYESGKSGFAAYASKCVGNAMTDSIRRFMRLSHQNTELYLNDMGEQLLHREASPVSDSQQPEDVYARGEQSRIRMRQIQSRLSGFEQKVLRLYLGGYPYQQIASVTSSTVKGVDNALQRIRRKLRPSGRN